jgi:diguanylate cyclase (GGDEF)-like protein
MPSFPDNLSHAPLFHGVPAGAVEMFVAASVRRELAPGETLLRAGQSNEYLFIVLKGSVLVRIGERSEVSLGPGECVGELSIIDRSRTSGDVTTREQTAVLAAHRNEVWALIDSAPEVARNLLRILAGRVRHDNAMLDETRRLQSRFEQEAIVDAVTGVKNRRWLEEAFDEVAKGLCARGGQASLLMIDLDHFKQVNDAHGHAVGDIILRRTAQTLAGALRPTDLLARYGGEEFAAFLPDTGAPEAIAVAERLRHAVQIAPADAGVPPVSISVGVASAKPPASVDAMLLAADAALYRAKQAGRNCVSV